MAILDVTDVEVVGFALDTTVTTTGGTFIALSNNWYGIPRGQTSMTVTPAGDAMCMLRGRDRELGSKVFIQCMTVDEIRVSA